MLQWLQVFGRFHMLVLHLPIGLLAGIAAVEFFALARRRAPARDVTGPLVWLAAASATLAAAMGYVLSFESGYSGDVLTQHLYLGVALAGVCVLTAILHARERRIFFRASLIVALVLLIPTGHLGGTMTHGEDFLLRPLHTAGTPVAPAPTTATTSAPTFATAIAPILEARCLSCHGENRSRGGLALHTPEAIAKGGEHGPVIVTGDPASSELLRRLRLPVDHDDHMPPQTKPQPTQEEILAFESWITSGASFEAAFSVSSHGHAHDSSTRAAKPAIRGAPDPLAPPSLTPPPPTAPPSTSAIAALRTRLAHVEPIEPGSNLLWVDFAAAATTITDADIELLLVPLQDNIADLSLSRSAITDRALGTLAGMPNLRRLDLRATGVTDTGVGALRSHRSLEELILAQTRLTDGAVHHLAAMPALARVNLWRCGITPDAAIKLSARRDSLVIETGDRPVGAPIQTEDPIKLTGDAPIALPAAAPAPSPSLTPINTVCPVSGKAVDPDYVIIYKGRVIGFCCRHCEGEFWANPGKFEKSLDKK